MYVDTYYYLLTTHHSRLTPPPRAGPQRSGLPPTELSRIPLPPRPPPRKAASGGSSSNANASPERRPRPGQGALPRQGSARERWGAVAQSQLPRHERQGDNQRHGSPAIAARQRESSPARDRGSPSRRCSERSGRSEASAASDQGGPQGGAQGAPPSLLRGPSPIPGGGQSSLRGPSPTLGTQSSLLRAPSPHRA